jgi:hypothetical protein
MEDQNIVEWKQSLASFHKIIDGNPAPDKVKDKLLGLKESTKISNILNQRQKEAIIARCDFYIAGEYGKTKTSENIQYGQPDKSQLNGKP